MTNDNCCALGRILITRAGYGRAGILSEGDVRGWLAVVDIKPVAGEGQLLVALRSLARLLRRTTAVLMREDSTRPPAVIQMDAVHRSALLGKAPSVSQRSHS